MSRPQLFPRLATLALSGLALTSCLNLKQVTDPTRFYVLSAMPAETAATVNPPGDLAVGLGRVDLPDYLLDNRIVLRQGAHEIHYAEYHRWAERLDKGVQRVLGANLSALLPSASVVLSAWRREDVKVEVYVSVQRFEFNERGQVVLEARWRITTPGGEKTWRSHHSQITRQGPVWHADPEGAVGVLSEALADLSRAIATELRHPTGSANEPKIKP